MMSEADANRRLAASLGRFAQAAANLEAMIASAITRLLPITDNLGHELFDANSASRNREILESILNLPEVPIPDEWRRRIKGAISSVRQFQEDRNRLLHNRIIAGPQGLVVLRHGRAGIAALPISIEQIDAWAEEARELAAWIGTVPHAEYDFDAFGKAWPAYPTKPWPGRQGSA